MFSESDKLRYKELIIGKWVDDPEDFESIRRYGHITMEFKNDGKLIYTAHKESGKNSVSLCVYRVEGNYLITDQPSAPKEVKSLIEFSTDNNLMIKTDGFSSYLVRDIK